jgi:mRNA interferase YafQ
MKKRGKELPKIKEVMSQLIAEEPLVERYRDHPLIGNYKGRRECHIEPNWLLIYKLEDANIIFERTGTHSDLFE